MAAVANNETPRLERLFRPWVERVAHLRTWGRVMTDVRVEIKVGRGSGTAWAHLRKIILRLDEREPARAIAIIVHEFAHCAVHADCEGHDDRFKARLRAATLELTGHDPGLVENYRTFQRSVDHAVAAWWQASHAKAWAAAQAFERLGGER